MPNEVKIVFVLGGILSLLAGNSFLLELSDACNFSSA